MLSINKCKIQFELEENYNLRATKLINGRLCMIEVQCGETIVSFVSNVSKVCKLSDELFVEFDRIRRDVELVSLP